jgi:hypothetical protein
VDRQKIKIHLKGQAFGYPQQGGKSSGKVSLGIHLD